VDNLELIFRDMRIAGGCGEGEIKFPLDEKYSSTF